MMKIIEEKVFREKQFPLILLVCVVLFNHSGEDFKILPGDRIAQLIIEKISDTGIVEVDQLDDTSRGAGGFGSTGVSVGDVKTPIIQNTVENNCK